MNWEAIGAAGEILGAIAVIASLFYVAYQVKQNTRQNKLNAISMESANSEAINIAHNDARLRLAENPELLRAYLNGQKDPESLSEEETLMFRLFMAAGISNGQLSYESDQRGVSSQWQGMQNVALRMLLTPGGRWFWKEFRQDYPKDFQAEIDRLIKERSK